ncbi:hypothetical protein [Nocardia lasii]|uniref:Transposase n=1 Tax=Nocardia lasii TaxID=1616107 RepID=A0ABW1JWG0_9NOCA
MPRQTKVELYAAIRRDARAGMSGRASQTKYGVGWRTVQAATNAAWPNQRRKYPTRGSKLDPFKPFIDEVLRAELRAPRKQRHTIKRLYARLLDEHGMDDVAYQTLRDYIAERKPQVHAEEGKGPAEVFIRQTHHLRATPTMSASRRPGPPPLQYLPQPRRTPRTINADLQHLRADDVLHGLQGHRSAVVPRLPASLCGLHEMRCHETNPRRNPPRTALRHLRPTRPLPMACLPRLR